SRVDQKYLVFVFNTIAEKRQPLPIRRPARIRRRLVAASELKTLTILAVDQRDLRDECVLLEVAIANCVRNPFAVRRDLRSGDRFQRQEIVECGDVLSICDADRCRDDGKQKDESLDHSDGPFGINASRMLAVRTQDALRSILLNYFEVDPLS